VRGAPRRAVLRRMPPHKRMTDHTRIWKSGVSSTGMVATWADIGLEEMKAEGENVEERGDMASKYGIWRIRENSKEWRASKESVSKAINESSGSKLA